MLYSSSTCSIVAVAGTGEPSENRVVGGGGADARVDTRACLTLKI